MDRRDPAQVALGWGCGFFAHPKGETPPQAARRLAAIASPEVTAALADTQLPHYGKTTVRVLPGAPSRDTGRGDWTVRCTAVTTNPDGESVEGSPQPVTMRLQLAQRPTGWQVIKAWPNDVPLP